MAQLIIDIPDDKLGRVKVVAEQLGPLLLGDAFGAPAGNKKPGTALTNAEARNVLVAMVKRFLRDMVKQVESEAAAAAARDAALASVDNDGVIP